MLVRANEEAWPHVATRLYLAPAADEEKTAGGQGGDEEQDPDRGPDSEVLELRFDTEFLHLIREKAERLGTDVSTFVRWSIRTGILLGDLGSLCAFEDGRGTVSPPLP